MKTDKEIAKQFRHTAKWKRVKNDIVWRDNNRCKICNMLPRKNKISIHHITKIRDDFSLVYDPNNLISLCLSCHKKIDSGSLSFFDNEGNWLKTEDYLRGLINEDSRK